MSSECLAVTSLESYPDLSLPQPVQKATFNSIYSQAALYEAALRVYTKPLFFREKGLVTSHDKRTLYHFALHGPQNVEQLHRCLSLQEFRFREGVEVHFLKGRKRRTVYIFPWEERIVDEFLYQTLNKFFHFAFSEGSYAFRYRGFGVDACQHRIARCLQRSPRPVYVIKRDVSNYFASVDQDVLLRLLEQWIEKDDYLYELVRDRVRFWVRTGDRDKVPGPGIPSGTALACLLANIYLTPLDLEMARVPSLTYFRYADDLFAFSQSREAALEGTGRINAMLSKLRLKSKISHEMNLVFAEGCTADDGFTSAPRFRHLGLEFRIDGSVGLSREKGRKVRRVFRRAFQDAAGNLQALRNPQERAKLLISISRQVIERGVRSIAILDYYLKHVDDDEQLRLMDRWLAEEVLARTFQSGHCKGNFRRLSFKRLREMGLPSLRHRGRLLRHGRLKSTFFMLWTSSLGEREGSVKGNHQSSQVQEERGRLPGRKTLSPHLEAAAAAIP